MGAYSVVFGLIIISLVFSIDGGSQFKVRKNYGIRYNYFTH